MMKSERKNEIVSLRQLSCIQAVMHYGESIKAIGNEVRSSELLHTLRGCSYLLFSFLTFPDNL